MQSLAGSCDQARAALFASLGFTLPVCSRILTLKDRASGEIVGSLVGFSRTWLIRRKKRQKRWNFCQPNREIGESGSCEEYEERKERVENERNGGKASDSEKMKGSGGWSVNGDLGPPYMLMLD